MKHKLPETSYDTDEKFNKRKRMIKANSSVIVENVITTHMHTYDYTHKEYINITNSPVNQSSE